MATGTFSPLPLSMRAEFLPREPTPLPTKPQAPSGRRGSQSDPIDEGISKLTKQKTDLGRFREAIKNHREAFMANEGADLFERDSLTGEVLKDPVTKKPAMRFEGGAGTQEMIALRERAATDRAAAEELALREKHLKLALDRWNRIQGDDERAIAATTDVENQLGELSAQRYAQSVASQGGRITLPGGPSPGAPAAAPAPENKQPGFAVRDMPDGSVIAAGGAGSGPMRFGSREEAERHFQSDRAPRTAAAAAPVLDGPAPAAPAPDTNPAPAEAPQVTPLSLVKMHRQIRDAEAVAAMGTSSEGLKTASNEKAAELRRQFAAGMGALDPEAQKRVADATRDPTFWEQLGNFGSRVAEGAGTTLVEVGEFAARQGARAANALGADIDPSNNAATAFAQAMREVASEWGPDVAKEVQAKLDNSFGSALGQGLGSAVAFMAPGMMLGRLGKAAGLSNKAAKALVTVGVGVTGAAASGNAMRREAESELGRLAQTGEITNEEYRRGVNQAEVINTLVGTGEAWPISKFATRLAKLPGGRSFINGLLKRLSTDGVEGAGKWLRGAGREALYRTGRAAGEGFEEAVQEFGQNVAENLTAAGKFGNVGWDPDRATFTAEGSESAGVGFLVGALLGAATGGRQRRQGDAQAPVAPDDTPAPGEAVIEEIADDTPPAADDDLMAELRGQAAPAAAPSDQPVQENVSAEADFGAVAEQPAAPAPSEEPVDYRYTVQRPQEINGRTIPGYVQIDPLVNEGRGEPLTDEQRAALPQAPDWLPTGQYTAAEIAEAIEQGPPDQLPAEGTAENPSSEAGESMPPATVPVQQEPSPTPTTAPTASAAEPISTQEPAGEAGSAPDAGAGAETEPAPAPVAESTSAAPPRADAAPEGASPASSATSRPPALGDKPESVWREWRSLTGTRVHPGETVVGFIPGEGTFGFNSNGKLERLRTSGSKTTGILATTEPLTEKEEAAVFDALSKGQLQIERRKITGAGGVHGRSDAGATVKVLHQATGYAMDPKIAAQQRAEAEARVKGAAARMGAEDTSHVRNQEKPTEEGQEALQVGGESPAPVEAGAGTPPAVDDTPEGRTSRAADAIAPLLDRGRAFDWRELFAATDSAFGGTQASGAYTPKDAYDALELAVNRQILRMGGMEAETAEKANNVVKNLRRMILEKIPTQSKRTAEQDAMQQFSTPPTLAYAANWVAGVRADDVYLEPSAGIGGLAVFGKKAGARVIANEFSPRRQAILDRSGITDTVLTENAENLHAILTPRIKRGDLPQPTVVVMNPPFSNGAVSGKRGDTMIGAKHVEEALKLLAPNGRLVAIVGEGMAFGKPTFRQWWTRIGKTYNVRANVGISGAEYRKYGTTFDNQLLVIDKAAPDGRPPIQGKVATVEEVVTLLQEVHRDRPSQTKQTAVSQPPAQSSGDARPDPSEGRPGPRANRPDASPGASDAPSSGERPTAPESISASEQSGESGQGARETEQGTDSGRADAGNTGTDSGTTGDGASVAPDQGVEVGKKKPSKSKRVDDDEVFSEYSPAKMKVAGVQPHPTALVESSAMAAVSPPDPVYRPKLPKDVVQGALSDAQLENVVYAGQAHSKMLPDGTRAGYFIGDGTGVGKGRQIAAIILDNWRQGRKKAVWISKTGTLAEDAKRDLKDLGMDPGLLAPINKAAKAKVGTIGLKQGIIFSTYTSLAKENNGRNAEGELIRTEGKKSRLEQIVDWLGKDFDGVIALDESHMAGNAVAVKGNRGVRKPSETGLSIVDLQWLLPKARIVYMSATGATEVSNLSYAERLGIWGVGTPFTNKQAFIDQISAGGISSMEIVARDLKALGKYLSRTLSFKGVNFDKLEQSLTPNQLEVYDEVAKAWQGVFSNVDDAMSTSGASNSPRARSAARSAFFGAQQRFFNQLLTAMEMPAVLSDMRKQLDAGHSAVLQLVNTNAAPQDREIARAMTEEQADLEDLDLSPKDILLQYVNNSFPVAKYEEVADPNNPDRTKWVPVRDSDGNIVEDPDALAKRDELLGSIATLRVPENPLEMVLNTFGHDAVAEITGRGQRVVIKEKDGQMVRQIEGNRSESTRKVEAKEFQDGRRRILVFSGAGGTGFSYHASRKAKNQQLRVHYLVQAGWRADAALQGFGRTHRSDQAQPPIYKLVTTNIQGHKRFISTIARRLAQLGALTSGERKSTGQGMFSEKDNLESKYAEEALTRFFHDLYTNRADGLNFDSLTRKMGFGYTNDDGEWVSALIDKENGGLSAAKLPTVQQFLNRLLVLEVKEQNRVFDGFFGRLETRIDNAKADGTYDPGMQTYKAKSIVKKADEVVYQHPESTAETRIVEIEAADPVRFTKFSDVAKMGSTPIERYVRNARSGRIYALKDGGIRTLETGAVEKAFRRIGTHAAEIIPQREFSGERYETLTEKQAQEAWDAEIKGADKMQRRTAHFIVGSFLPIWDRIKLGSPRIYRLTTDKGETMLGASIPPKFLAGVRQRLGAKSGAVTPEAAFRAIVDDGATYELANGWRLKRVRVSGDYRIELIGSPYSYQSEFTGHVGGFIERINYAPRLFISTDSGQGVDALGKVLAKSPIIGDGSGAMTESPLTNVTASTAEQKGFDQTGPTVMSFEPATPDDYDATAFRHAQQFEDAENAERRTEARRTGQPIPPRIRYRVVRGPIVGDSPAGDTGELLPRDRDAKSASEVARLRRGLEIAFQKRFVFVRPSEPVTWGAKTAANRSNTIIVNADAAMPFQAMAGHELTHNLKAQRSNLYKRLRETVLDIYPPPPGYLALKERQKYDTPEKREDEWIADMVGQRFDEPEFWQELAERSERNGNDGFFTDLARAVMDWLGKIARRINQVFSLLTTDPFISDIERMRGTVAQVFAEYQKGGPYLQEPGADTSTVPDAALSTIGDVQASTIAPPPDAEEKPGEGREFSLFPDSLRERGQPVDRIEYDVRPQAEVAEEAKQFISANGETEAERAALDRKSSMRGDVRVGVIGELVGRRAEALKEAGPEEIERITAEMNRLVAAAQPSLATEAGQQISMFNHIYKDQRVAASMEYVKDMQKRQRQGMGEATDKAVDETVDAMDEATRKAIDDLERGLPSRLRKVKVSKSIWQRYRDNTAQRMIDLVAKRLAPPPELAPLQEFVQRVAKEVQTRIEAALPEKAKRSELTPAQALREAIDNKEKYAEVLTSVRSALAEQYGENLDLMDRIDVELANLGLRPYSDKLLDRAIRDAHAAMGVKVGDLARQHFTKTDADAGALAKALVKEAGLTGADATRVGGEITDRARTLVAAARNKALEAMKRKHDTPKAKKALEAIGRATLLNNLGALSREDMMPVVAKALRLPTADPKRMKRIAELADAVETATDASERSKAELSLLNEIRIARGFSKADMVTAIWFANMLSGYTTQAVNIAGNTMNGVLQLATVAAANPRHMGRALAGYIEGFGEGWQQAKTIMATGRGSREFDARTGVASPTLELVDYARDFPDLNKAIAKGLNLHAKAMRYVFRFMKGMDAFFFFPAREAYARVATAKLLEADYKGAELNRKIRENLGIAPDQFIAAREKAKREGFTGFDLALRMTAIMEEHRQGSDTGRKASEDAERFGLLATYNNEPEGWAGIMYQHMARLTDSFRPGGAPVLKAFLPFLRVPTNIFNVSMNFTPIGALRALRGMPVNAARAGDRVVVERREMTADERNRLLIQSIGGSIAMGALAAMAMQDADDDEEPFFTITATGPEDWRKRQQLEATGWKQHSIKFGDLWIPYKDAPILTPLAVVGHVVDSIRYEKAKDDATLGSQTLDAILKAPRVIFDTSMLSGLGQLFDFLQDRSGSARLTQFLTRTPTSIVVPNFLSQVDRTFNPGLREADGPLAAVGAGLPFARNTGTIRTDVQGEKVERRPLDRFISMETNDPVREVLRDKNVFISVPSKTTKLGNRAMEPEEYRDYVRVSGERIRQRLSGAVPMLRKMNREQVEKLVDRITRQERTRAKAVVARGMAERN